MNWKERFLEITKIPRPSGKEDAICAYLIDFAEKNGFAWQTDDAGNLMIDVLATAGYENHPGVVIQGHTDMVCVKTADSPVNFETDPIPVVEKEGWLCADGTSLGADNGVALAYAAALCEDSTAVHPALRLLLTRCEEEGLCGAAALHPEAFRYNRLINLDSEEDAVIYAGCAGGLTLCGRRQRTAAAAGERGGGRFYKMSLSGLPGGHSGSDIHQNRPNAIVEAAKIIRDLGDRAPLQLCSLTGGEKHNVIPSQAEAVFASELSGSEIEAVLSGVRDGLPAGAALTLSGTGEEHGLDESTAAALVAVLTELPCGVIEFSREFEETVETSANPAIVRCGSDGNSEVIISVRSLAAEKLASVAETVRAVFRKHGFATEESDGYPAWTPNPQSPLIALARRAYRENGTEAAVKVIHAGLECGLFADRKPGIDMVSFGPRMENVHSVRERLDIASGDRTYAVLKTLLSLC